MTSAAAEKLAADIAESAKVTEKYHARFPADAPETMAFISHLRHARESGKRP